MSTTLILHVMRSCRDQFDVRPLITMGIGGRWKQCASGNASSHTLRRRGANSACLRHELQAVLINQ